MHKHKLILFALLTIFIGTFAFLSVHLTKKADSASLTAGKVTLADSRISFKAGVTSGTSGTSVVVIDGSSNPDITTSHLFPGDVLCFTDEGINGCIGNKTYTVASIINGTTFNLNTALTDNLDTLGYAVASQSGQWTISFTTVGEVPAGGNILITIPEVNGSAKGNDGIPDSAASIAASGFDLNNAAGTLNSRMTVTGCTDGDWSTPSVVAGDGTTNHTIEIPRVDTACAATSPIVITLGTSAPYIVNPAPYVDVGRNQGTADVYGITVQTRDGGDNVIDSAIPRAAPVEAVLISATVDESLSFVVNAVTGGDLYANASWCGTIPIASDAKSSTVTSIPWGTLASANHFYYSAQKLTVNTNAAGGYVVTIQESDQMGKNGNVCTGTSPTVGEYTFDTATCIRDTVCASSNCSESVAADWTVAATYPGLGYSLSTVSGSLSDATFYFNEKNRAWSARQLADKQGSETPANIMYHGGPVSDSAVYVCYKLTIPGTQPAGYYYNIAKYTATATF